MVGVVPLNFFPRAEMRSCVLSQTAVENAITFLNHCTEPKKGGQELRTDFPLSSRAVCLPGHDIDDLLGGWIDDQDLVLQHGIVIRLYCWNAAAHVTR